MYGGHLETTTHSSTLSTRTQCKGRFWWAADAAVSHKLRWSVRSFKSSGKMKYPWNLARSNCKMKLYSLVSHRSYDLFLPYTMKEILIYIVPKCLMIIFEFPKHTLYLSHREGAWVRQQTTVRQVVVLVPGGRGRRVATLKFQVIHTQIKRKKNVYNRRKLILKNHGERVVRSLPYPQVGRGADKCDIHHLYYCFLFTILATVCTFGKAT